MVDNCFYWIEYEPTGVEWVVAKLSHVCSS